MNIIYSRYSRLLNHNLNSHAKKICKLRLTKLFRMVVYVIINLPYQSLAIANGLKEVMVKTIVLRVGALP